MPEFHSKVVGSSTTYRRINCLGSQALEEKVPDDGGSGAAREGTDLHSIMERWVDGEIDDPQVGHSYGPEIPALTQEQLDALIWCWNIVDPLIGDNEFALEKYLEFPGVEGAGGTGDVIIWNADGSVTIADYKFGRGVPVSVDNMKGRSQLLFVAACVRAKYGEAHTYHLHILQPRLDSHTKISVANHDLDAFVNLVQTAVKNFGPTYSIGDWCQFCKGAPMCPAKMELAQAAYQWNDLAHNDLPAALAIVDEVEAWAKEVRKMAHQAMDQGASIQGWKLVAKRATRKWGLPDDVVHRRLQKAGLKIDQRAPRTLISPPQAEKLKVKLSDDMVTANSTGNTMVRESDPRPAVNVVENDLQSLAAIITNGKTED